MGTGVFDRTTELASTSHVAGDESSWSASQRSWSSPSIVRAGSVASSHTGPMSAPHTGALRYWRSSRRWKAASRP